MLLEQARDTEPAPPRPAEPRLRKARRLVDPLRWNDLHRALAAQPPFASCTRAEIRRLVHEGDRCRAAAGEVLCREDQIAYWLFAVLDCSVVLSRRGRWHATIAGGGHVGAAAIIGFGPQHHTATTIVDTDVFVLGRRAVLDCSYSIPALQSGLFPDVARGDYPGMVRRLRSDAGAAWKRMQRETADRAARAGADPRLPASLQVVPSRARRPGAVPFSPALLRSVPRVRAAVASPRPLDRRIVGALVLVVLAGLGLFAANFHPGVLVVRPSAPIEVTADVEVAGLEVRPPTGRYILTAVDVSEPDLLGVVAAAARGDERLPAGGGAADGDDHLRLLRAQLADSQQRAVRVVAERAGVDPASVRVTFRDRDVSGPSAGLVYALVLADMTGQLTVPPGRVVAATGVLADGGRIGTVGWVAQKAQVARSARADVFLVPADAATGGAVAVTSFDDALRAAAD